MGIALIVMLPISIVVAATMRFTLGPSMWFQIHRALGVSRHSLLDASACLLSDLLSQRVSWGIW